MWNKWFLLKKDEQKKAQNKDFQGSVTHYAAAFGLNFLMLWIYVAVISSFKEQEMFTVQILIENMHWEQRLMNVEAETKAIVLIFLRKGILKYRNGVCWDGKDKDAHC